MGADLGPVLATVDPLRGMPPSESSSILSRKTRKSTSLYHPTNVVSTVLRLLPSTFLLFLFKELKQVISRATLKQFLFGRLRPNDDDGLDCEWQRHGVSETSVSARASHVNILGHQHRDNRSESTTSTLPVYPSRSIERLCPLSKALIKAMAGGSSRTSRWKWFRRGKGSQDGSGAQNDSPASGYVVRTNPAESMEHWGSLVFPADEL